MHTDLSPLQMEELRGIIVEHFGVRLPEEEVAEISTVGDLSRIIARQLP